MHLAISEDTEATIAKPPLARPVARGQRALSPHAARPKPQQLPCQLLAPAPDREAKGVEISPHMFSIRVSHDCIMTHTNMVQFLVQFFVKVHHKLHQSSTYMVQFVVHFLTKLYYKLHKPFTYMVQFVVHFVNKLHHKLHRSFTYNMQCVVLFRSNKHHCTTLRHDSNKSSRTYSLDDQCR